MSAVGGAADATGTMPPNRLAARPTLVATPSLRHWRTQLALPQWRTQLALPQTELADLARVNVSTIYRLEAGAEAPLSTVRRLADALEVTPTQLIAQPPPDA